MQTIYSLKQCHQKTWSIMFQQKFHQDELLVLFTSTTSAIYQANHTGEQIFPPSLNIRKGYATKL